MGTLGACPLCEPWQNVNPQKKELKSVNQNELNQTPKKIPKSGSHYSGNVYPFKFFESTHMHMLIFLHEPTYFDSQGIKSIKLSLNEFVNQTYVNHFNRDPFGFNFTQVHTFLWFT